MASASPEEPNAAQAPLGAARCFSRRLTLASKAEAPLAPLDPRGRLGQGSPPQNPNGPSHAQIAAPAKSRQGDRHTQIAAPAQQPASPPATLSVRICGDLRASAASARGSDPDGRGLYPVAARGRHPRGDAPAHGLECRRLGVPHHDSAHGYGPEARGERSVQARGREPVGAGGPRNCRGARGHRGDRLGARPGQEPRPAGRRPGIWRWSARP